MKIVIHTFFTKLLIVQNYPSLKHMFKLRLKKSNIQNKKKDQKEIGNDNFSTSLNTYVQK